MSVKDKYFIQWLVRINAALCFASLASARRAACKAWTDLEGRSFVRIRFCFLPQ